MKKLAITMIFLLTVTPAYGQNFDLEKIRDIAATYSVSVNILIEVSFGTQTTEAKSRGIGTVVSSDGLVIFDATAINSDDPFSIMSGMQVTADPKEIEVVAMDGTKYYAEFIGIDRFTKIGFCKIIVEDDTKFKYVKFKKRDKFKIGEWLALFTLLPEYVQPPLGADIGLISAMLREPEEFMLTVGFNDLEIGSVLYDSTGTPVGVLGNLDNPALSGFDASRMMESFSNIDELLPLLGLIDADRLNKLIKAPPKKGKPDRGWLGVYLQALTTDIAEFWGMDARGGIIINDVVKDSPADMAGIKTGDVIIALSNRPIEVDKEENLPIFQKQISELGAGASVDLSLIRRDSGKIDTLDVTVMLADAPLSPAEAPEYEDEYFEMKLRDMVFADYNIYNLKPDKFKGVVVKEIEPGGWSAVGSIMPGDIIQSIGGTKIESIEDAKVALKKASSEKPDEVIFFVWRDNKTLFINIKTDWQE